MEPRVPFRECLSSALLDQQIGQESRLDFPEHLPYVRTSRVGKSKSSSYDRSSIFASSTQRILEVNLQQKKLIAFCSLAVVVGIPTALVLVLDERISPDPPPLGSMLRCFSGQFANGTTMTSEDLIGRKLALIFFKFDCPHCQREIQNFETLSKSHDALGLQFLAIPLHDARTTEE